MSGSSHGGQTDPAGKQGYSKGDRSAEETQSGHPPNQSDWDEALQAMELSPPQYSSARDPLPHLTPPHVNTQPPPLVMVETAFLASTASLLWFVSYYLSVVPWMRILFPIPIALAYMRWGRRAGWMAALVSGLLLSVLMGPYLSLLFLLPYGLLGVQLGFMWRRGSPWAPSIWTGTLISTFCFFFRIGLLSIFLGEDLWTYLTNRMTEVLQWGLSLLVDWGLLGIDVLTQTNVTVVQIAVVGVVGLSDLVYMFTVHLVAWLLLERLGNPIPEPPEWVKVLMEEER